MFKINEILTVAKGKLLSGRKVGRVRGISTDTRTIGPDEAFLALKGENFDGHDFIGEAIKKGSSCIICNPSHRYVLSSKRVSFIEVKDTTKALGDIAAFQRLKFDIPVICITGSNGKTTTKEMVASCLSSKFKVLKNEGTKNNHIGLPLTLLNLDSSYEAAVLELGTNHFGEIDYLAAIAKPDIAVITNIGESHLEHFRDLKGVFKEKYSLVKHLSRQGACLFNSDDNLLRIESDENVNAEVVLSFGIENQSDFSATDISNSNKQIEFVVNKLHRMKLNTVGYFNIYNALVAIGLARVFGIEYEDIRKTLAAFEFPPSRLNLMRQDKIMFINDTYNSNPLSLSQAMEVLRNFETKGRKIMVMGDMLELGRDKSIYHNRAGKKAAGVCDVFLTVGRLSESAAEAARKSGLDIGKIFTCENSLEARKILFEKILPQKDDVVLVKGSRSMKMEEVFKK
jgi:UDP-N-acetylmuramoyl-tripeptide--D-alanyl-D-alanine ligase